MTSLDESILRHPSARLVKQIDAPVDPRRPWLAAAALNALFRVAPRAPWLLRWLRPLAVRSTVILSHAVRRNTRLNASRIFRRALDNAEQRDFTESVVGNFYDFVTDMGRSAAQSVDQLLARVDNVHGLERYRAARAAGRGAVLVTAHIGSFEIGLAALRREESNVCVVFKRDSFGAFERLRARIRAKLGVHGAPIDDGLLSLLRLRDALVANAVVVLQGDRAMPGQRAQIVPFLGGSICLPIGPLKLARLTGSPIIPVFVIPGQRRDHFDIHLGEPIAPSDHAIFAIAHEIQTIVSRYPDRWLTLDRAFFEDADNV